MQHRLMSDVNETHLSKANKLYLLSVIVAVGSIFTKMEKYHHFEKYNMLECYIERHKNAQAALDLYFERYPEREQPNKTIFSRLERNLTNYGSFKKERPKNYYKENEDTTINVIGCVAANPTTSSRNIEKYVGVPRTTSLRILKKHKYKCYKARKTQHLRPGDPERRIFFCNWYLNKVQEDESFFKKIIWTDESRVTSEGIFNIHNNHQWAQNNSHLQVNRIHQGRFGFNVWVALLNDRILAYEVFENNLNSVRYLEIIERNIINYLDNLALQESQQIYFQQDGAPAHNARNIVDCLGANFGHQWIANNGPNRWPARSPDITLLDFFFWGFIKNKIYLNRSETLAELRNNFETAMRSITNIHIRNALNAVSRRCQICVEKNGQQFEHFL